MWIPALGEKALHVPTNTIFVVRRRRRVKDKIFLYDQDSEDGVEYCLEDCIQPLNESELSTLRDMVQVSIEDNDPEIIDALNPLSAAHKRQMWDSLTEEMQSELLRLRKVSLEVFKEVA